MTEEKDKSMEWRPVYDSAFAIKGYKCSHCGYYSVVKYDGCLFCKRPARKAPDKDGGERND